MKFKKLPIKRWFSFNFAKNLKDYRFTVGDVKSFKLLADISFESCFQVIIFLSLLLFLCARY